MGHAELAPLSLTPQKGDHRSRRVSNGEATEDKKRGRGRQEKGSGVFLDMWRGMESMRREDTVSGTISRRVAGLPLHFPA